MRGILVYMPDIECLMVIALNAARTIFIFFSAEIPAAAGTTLFLSAEQHRSTMGYI